MTQDPHDRGPAAPDHGHRRRTTDWDTLVARAEGEQPVEAPPARARRSWPRGLARALLVLVVVGIGLGVGKVTEAPAPDDADLDRGRRALLALIDSSLADHLRLHGSYPESLQEVLPLRVQVNYQRTEDGYVATVRLSDGSPVTVRKP